MGKWNSWISKMQLVDQSNWLFWDLHLALKLCESGSTAWLVQSSCIIFSCPCIWFHLVQSSWGSRFNRWRRWKAMECFCSSKLDYLRRSTVPVPASRTSRAYSRSSTTVASLTIAQRTSLSMARPGVPPGSMMMATTSASGATVRRRHVVYKSALLTKDV